MVLPIIAVVFDEVRVCWLALGVKLHDRIDVGHDFIHVALVEFLTNLLPGLLHDVLVQLLGVDDVDQNLTLLPH